METIGLIIIMVLFGLVAVIGSIINIFLPAKWGWSKEHLETCGLRHKTFMDRVWHCIDTRANILSFELSGSSPLHSSPNRGAWLRREMDFLEKESKDKSMDSLCPGYTDFCRREYEKMEKELVILSTTNT